MSYFMAPTQNFVSTTLNGSINDSVDTITLNDASKLQAPGYIVIDREDGNNTATPNAREVVYFTGKSGNQLTGCQRGADGSTARSHSDGALVEATMTVGMWNSLATAVSSSLDENGTGLHVSNATVSGIVQAPRLSISSVASIPVIRVSTHIDASAASVTGFGGGFNALWSVPGSLASQADVGGTILVPNAYKAQYLIGYVKTPASIASVSAFILKQGGTVVGMLGIAGAGTYGSSASLAVTDLAVGDVLTLDIRSTASLSADLSVVLRAI